MASRKLKVFRSEYARMYQSIKGRSYINISTDIAHKLLQERYSAHWYRYQGSPLVYMEQVYKIRLNYSWNDKQKSVTAVSIGS